MELTNEQQAAVDARGGSLTLSAAAGSGKTRVLTERVAARVLDRENPIDADRLLIVTFTRAAAAEMQSRITERISQHLRENPHDERAKRQRLLLGRAQIGTIDSLCSTILRENFQQAGIPATFRIGDDAEIRTMQEQAISDVLEESYRAANPAFLDLADLFSNAANDSELSNIIVSILNFARSHPYYRKWIDEKLVIYRDFTHPRDSTWADILFRQAKALAESDAARLRILLEKIDVEADLAPFRNVLAYDIAVLESICRLSDEHNWDGCVCVLEKYEPQRFPIVRKISAERREPIKNARDHAKKLIQDILPVKIFPASEKDFAEDVADLLPKVDCLFNLVREVDDRLQSEKVASGILDFADLEQFVCALLTNEDGTATQLADECAARYDEVMLDESQDINEVQNRILSALSKKSGLFCVGDVKQCIYRFRMACPQLFLERVAAGHLYDGTHFPATLYLNGNFRTAPEVTGIINSLFAAIMSRDAGEVDYDETQALDPLGKFPVAEERGVDLCIIQKEKGLGEDDENLSAEPAWVAREISRLLKTAQVNDNGTMRPIKPGDIAILLRSPRSCAESYRRALSIAGIDADLSLDSGFLSAPEISSMLNYLTVLANPMRDVELLGTLSCPLGGFSDDELAEMRIKTPTGSLYFALLEYSRENTHAAEFLRGFEELRRLSVSLPPEELIGEILQRTGYDLLCRRMKHGKTRCANLMLLQHYAGQETGDVAPSLESFLRRIERIRSRGRDLPAAADTSGEGVAIMSIHRSKGLEWPIVFVCELEREHSFKKQDLQKPTILNSDCGFACVRRDKKTRRQFVSVPLAAVRADKKRYLLSEELRVLYVAMTRAKERLYLTGSINKIEKRLSAAAMTAAGQKKISSAVVSEGDTFFDWILPALSINANLEELAFNGQRVNGLRVRIETENTVLRAERHDDATTEPQIDEVAAAELADAMSRQYPHTEAAALPAKLSVSALTHGDSGTYFQGKPLFIDSRGAGGAEHGTAMHLFLQLCNVKAARNSLTDEIRQLSAEGAINAEQEKTLNLRQLTIFFKSGIAERMASCDRLLREYRMLAPASASSMASEYTVSGGESTMLQGVADCIIIKNSEATLVDYKTDKVHGDDELLSRYDKQLLLYRDLLAHQLGIPVREGYIYSFALGREIKVF